MKLLVCGGGGMLGSDVVRAAQLANHEVVVADRHLLDVTDAGAVARRVDRLRPDAVINCAAYTNVDGAEHDPGEAMRVNADGARNVAAAAAGVEATVVYPSTDYVFDGAKDGPYVESAEPKPLSRYGASKLAGEVDTAAVNPKHYLVRSSWLFGTAGKNFVETMLGIAEHQNEVLVVRDQVGCPTYTAHLAEGIVRLLDSGAFGVHHMAAGGRCSWYDFAVEIFSRAGSGTRVLSTTTAELGRPAARPEFSVLATQWDDAIHLPDWEVGLSDYLEERA
ncbi:dTDP-4-dehydrorhamnose reductase [soil metagenome]